MLSSVRTVFAGLKRSLEATILVVSLVASACLMAAAGGLTDKPWVAWYALLPLFVVIWACRPLVALLAGAFWGVSLYVFSVSGLNPALSPGVVALLLLAGVPAVYAGLGARLTRWMGFSPFVLGVGWIAVELVLQPLGLREGVLGGTHGDGTLMGYVAQALGYVHVAFIVALVNALLVSGLAGVPAAVASAYRASSTGRRERRLFPQTEACLSVFAIFLSRPRAPPIPAASLS